MSLYLLKTYNHVLAIQAWCAVNQGAAQIDVQTFELEIKARNRYFKLLPQFWQRMNGTPIHLPRITPDTEGFIGWLPYPPLQFQQLQDKLYFKRLLNANQQLTPAMWQSPSEATADYILKSSIGSFGMGLSRPYAKGTTPTETYPANAGNANANNTSAVFAEQFIHGKILKVWFWGGEAFHAHLHERPIITGDGASAVQGLVTQRLLALNQTWHNYPEADFVAQCLAYQGVTPTTVLEVGRTVWLDYRYGRHFARTESALDADNALTTLGAGLQQQIAQIGQLLAIEVKKEYDLPILFAVDAVLDDQGRAWWLEINSSPMFPPQATPKCCVRYLGFKSKYGNE